MIVMDETSCIIEALDSAARFFADESCGQCSPCREGTGWVHGILQRIVNGKGTLQDLDLLLEIAGSMGLLSPGSTICGLADAANWAVRLIVNKFWDEFAARVRKPDMSLAEVN